MGDFNAELSNNFVDSFCGSNTLKNLIKNIHTSKTQINPHAIKLTFTVLKSDFSKFDPKKLIYRDLKNFSNQRFRTELLKELNEKNIDGSQFELFQTISIGLFNKLAPTKQNTLRNDQSSFITKEVRKAVMTRLKLRNKVLKTKSQGM